MTVHSRESSRSTRRSCVSVIDSLIIALQDFGPARYTRGGSIMQISQTRVVHPVIMYGAVEGEIQKEWQRQESDKDSICREKEREREKEKRWEATPWHRVQAHRGVTRSCFNPTQREWIATPRETNQRATTVTRSLRGVDRCLIAEAEPDSLSLSSFRVQGRTDDVISRI